MCFSTLLPKRYHVYQLDTDDYDYAFAEIPVIDTYDFSLQCSTLGVFKEFVGTASFVGSSIPGISSNPVFCITVDICFYIFILTRQLVRLRLTFVIMGGALLAVHLIWSCKFTHFIITMVSKCHVVVTVKLQSMK